MWIEFIGHTHVCPGLHVSPTSSLSFLIRRPQSDDPCHHNTLIGINELPHPPLTTLVFILFHHHQAVPGSNRNIPAPTNYVSHRALESPDVPNSLSHIWRYCVLYTRLTPRWHTDR